MKDKRKLRLEALQRLANNKEGKDFISDDTDYYDNLEARREDRYNKVSDKYSKKSYQDIGNDIYDQKTKGMSQEEKEQLAEIEYRKKRKEAGLE